MMTSWHNYDERDGITMMTSWSKIWFASNFVIALFRNIQNCEQNFSMHSIPSPNKVSKHLHILNGLLKNINSNGLWKNINSNGLLKNINSNGLLKNINANGLVKNINSKGGGEYIFTAPTYRFSMLYTSITSPWLSKLLSSNKFYVLRRVYVLSRVTVHDNVWWHR